MKSSLRVFGLLGALLALGVSAGEPEDEPELEVIVTTPTEAYIMRNGVKAPHAMPKSKIFAAGNALDFDGIPPIGDPRGYHDGYRARGFRLPYFEDDNNRGSTDRLVSFWACGDNEDGFDCDNGFARREQIVMPTDVFKNKSNSCIRAILGHELFHHIQFGYTVDAGLPLACGYFPAAACEGHARAMQDKIYFDLDLDPAASCIATFRGQTRAYLKQPDQTIWDASYASALYWTYLMEQYGAYRQEPGLGSDFLVNWWTIAQANMNKASIVEVTEKAIKAADPKSSVTSSFHRFLMANTIKNMDLSTAGASFKRRYSYRDEDPATLPRINKMNLGTVVRTNSAAVPGNGSVIPIPVSAERFGGRYYDFNTSLCPAGRMVHFKVTGTLGLQPINGFIQFPDAMMGLVMTDAQNRPRKIATWRATDWSYYFLQDGYQSVRFALSGWRSDYAATAQMRCLPALPTPSVAGLGDGFALQTGVPGSVSHFDVDLPVPGEPNQSANGLPPGDFSIGLGTGSTGLLLPAIQKIREHAARMRVMVRAPSGLVAGVADAQLNVGPLQLQRSAAVRVAAHEPAVLLALDTSFSTGQPSGDSVLSKCQNNLKQMGLALQATTRVGLIQFAGTVAASPGNAAVVTPLGALNAAQRSALTAGIGGLTASTANRIRLTDVVQRAISEFNARGGAGERHLVVLTDGGESAGFDSTTLSASARAAGIRLHLVALGRRADQPLLARLAAETGGSFGYVDSISGGGIDSLALDQSLQAVSDRITRRQSGARLTGVLPPGTTVAQITFDPAAEISGLPARDRVIRGRVSGASNSVRLYRPDGSQVLAASNAEILRDGSDFAFHLPASPAGNWRLEMDGSPAGGNGSWQAQAAVVDSAQQLVLAVARAQPLDDRQTDYVTGDTLLLQAALVLTDSAQAPAFALATITTPNGTSQQLRLNDDGQFGDDHADDQVYSALYRATTIGGPSGFLDDESQPAVRGSYGFHATVDLGSATAARLLSASTAFSIRAGSTDGDGDTLPDRWEAALRCANPAVADANQDYDGDGLTLAAEYAAGTDPCDPDSDDGGESDGSERAAGRAPTDASDDGIKRVRHLTLTRETPDHVEATPLPGLAMQLRYDTDAGYAEVFVDRAPAPNGPFVRIATLSSANATGTFIDRAVATGTTYCYQLSARTASNAVAAGSPVVCDVARLDAAPPRGSIILNDGAPRTSNSLLQARLAIDGESFLGMQMQLTLPDGSQTDWLKWSPNSAIDASSAVGSASVEVQFRDPAGNLSTVYSDDIELIAPASVASIRGEVRSDTSLGDPDIALNAVDINPSIDTESPLQSTPAGLFTATDLSPGRYQFIFEKDGYLPTTVDEVVLSAGAQVDLGVVRMRKEVLFRDGFD